MDIRANKPVKHGFDHGPGGQDPIPGGGGGGIQFDTSPQSGDWLEITATGGGGLSGNGVFVNDSGGHGIEFDSAIGGQFLVSSEGPVIIQSFGSSAEIDGGQSTVVVQDDAGGSFGGVHIFGYAVTGGDGVHISWESNTMCRILADQAHGGYLIIDQLPTSAAGLPSNTVYVDSGVLKLAP